MPTASPARKDESAVATACVLIVEDDETLLLTLQHKLSREGYETMAASRGDDALQILRERTPDVILLDIMLPGINGLQLCRLIRRKSDVPILLLTALGAEGDRVAGLDAGADDYVIKPFGMKELSARIRALLRRHRPAAEAEAPCEPLFDLGDLMVDCGRREVRFRGQLVHLKPKEFDLLRYLVEHAGQVLSREQIVAGVWGADYVGGIRTVDVHMRWLRQKVEEDPASPGRIKTVRGAGYLFER
jgi:two-component system alkaline phosphatase synthesis response regulator PhoP